MQKRFGSVLLAGAFLASTLAPVRAQGTRPATHKATSFIDVAITYDATHADVIPSSSFWMQGGSVQLHGRFYGGLGAVADVAGMHIANINSTGVGLDIVTAAFGPRYTWSPARARNAVFAQGLVGVAHGFNGVFPFRNGVQTAASSLAAKAGGGVNVNLSPRVALRAFEVNWLRTQLPNSTNNAQNDVHFGAGIVFRFP
jgi:hypothetical protein